MKPYGLLGRKLSHSLSPEIHSLMCDYEYVLFEREPEQLDEFFASGEFEGINVTIPYKKDVIKYCSALSDTAKKIGSVNTITRLDDGTYYGDNSDYFGFTYMVKMSGIEIKGKKVLVLGTGGASLTVNAVLEDMGAGEIVSVSRSGEVNYQNVYSHADAEVIVNTTPVGMYPNNGERLLDLTRFKNLCGALDLIYNPSLTPLLYDAKNLGIKYQNGLTMLVAQAHMSAEKFIGAKIPEEKIESVISTLAAVRKNVVLIGMPGCGKSTISALLAQKLGREAVDTDSIVVSSQGRPIPEIFESKGEEYFRDAESLAAEECGKKGSLVIATGGGAVLRERNRYALKQNGVIVWLKRSRKELDCSGRPLSKDAHALERIERERLPIYSAFADVEVEVDPDEQVTLNRVLGALEGAVK